MHLTIELNLDNVTPRAGYAELDGKKFQATLLGFLDQDAFLVYIPRTSEYRMVSFGYIFATLHGKQFSADLFPVLGNKMSEVRDGEFVKKVQENSQSLEESNYKPLVVMKRGTELFQYEPETGSIIIGTTSDGCVVVLDDDDEGSVEILEKEDSVFRGFEFKVPEFASFDEEDFPKYKKIVDVTDLCECYAGWVLTKKYKLKKAFFTESDEGIFVSGKGYKPIYRESGHVFKDADEVVKFFINILARAYFCCKTYEMGDGVVKKIDRILNSYYGDAFGDDEYEDDEGDSEESEEDAFKIGGFDLEDLPRKVRKLLATVESEDID